MRISLGRSGRRGSTRAGSSAATAANPAHSSPRWTRCSSIDAAGPVAQGLLEQRVHLRRACRGCARHLGRVVQVDLGAGVVGPRAPTPSCVVQRSSSGAVSRSGPPRLGAADQDDIEVARRDLEACLASRGPAGSLPPIGLSASSRGWAPMRSATRRAGFAVPAREHRHDPHGVGPPRARRRWAPLSAAARRRASAIISTGSTAGSPRSTRLVHWPAPTSTGVRGIEGHRRCQANLLGGHEDLPAVGRGSRPRAGRLVRNRDPAGRHYDPRIDILFVCTGNNCRSPMAEALLRALLAEAGVALASVGSAGLLCDGAPADAQRRRRPWPGAASTSATTSARRLRRACSPARPSSSAWTGPTCARLCRPRPAPVPPDLHAEGAGAPRPGSAGAVARTSRCTPGWPATRAAAADLVGDDPADDVADLVGQLPDVYETRRTTARTDSAVRHAGRRTRSAACVMATGRGGPRRPQRRSPGIAPATDRR